MASPTSLLKRLLVGRPVRSDRLREPRLGKRVALPVLASDPVSSLAYAPGQILLTLSLGGAAAYAAAPWVAVAAVLVLLVVVASYRQNVYAYPSGGGDYEVATANLGGRAGLLVASALLIDYALTVAVSVSAAVDNLGSAIGYVGTHQVTFAVGAIAVLVALNLRGVPGTGSVFAVPTYAFLVVIVALVGVGLVRILVLGHDVRAASADLTVTTTGGFAGIAFAFLLARAFSGGAVVVTGVQTIAAGVPMFRPPKSRNAAVTLLTTAAVSAVLLPALVVLAELTGLRYVADPATQIAGAGPDYVQPTVTAQLADAVFGGFPLGFHAILAVTVLVLLVAANTAFTGFPVLGAILAQDRYLPRQLYTRGDRLVFSNGILVLAAVATVLIVGFRSSVTRLIDLYIVGVFASFTVTQAAMVRHWQRLLATETDPARRLRRNRSRAINAVGAVMTGAVLAVVLVTRFTHGAWISVAAIAAMYLLMRGIRSHYDEVARELTPAEQRPVLPARNHAVVLVSKLHLPTMRALAYAQATRPDTLTAVTVNVDEAETRMLVAEWEGRGLSVPLTVVDSPYREITRPILEYVKSVRRSSPRDVVTVFVPEYVVGRWWEGLLHNQSAHRVRKRLRYEPGVMVTNVPWRLASAAGKDLARIDRDLGRGPARGPRATTDVPDFERVPEQ